MNVDEVFSKTLINVVVKLYFCWNTVLNYLIRQICGCSSTLRQRLDWKNKTFSVSKSPGFRRAWQQEPWGGECTSVRRAGGLTGSRWVATPRRDVSGVRVELRWQDGRSVTLIHFVTSAGWTSGQSHPPSHHFGRQSLNLLARRLSVELWSFSWPPSGFRGPFPLRKRAWLDKSLSTDGQTLQIRSQKLHQSQCSMLFIFAFLTGVRVILSHNTSQCSFYTLWQSGL